MNEDIFLVNAYRRLSSDNWLKGACVECKGRVN